MSNKQHTRAHPFSHLLVVLVLLVVHLAPLVEAQQLFQAQTAVNNFGFSIQAQGNALIVQTPSGSGYMYELPGGSSVLSEYPMATVSSWTIEGCLSIQGSRAFFGTPNINTNRGGFSVLNRNQGGTNNWGVQMSQTNPVGTTGDKVGAGCMAQQGSGATLFLVCAPAGNQATPCTLYNSGNNYDTAGVISVNSVGPTNATEKIGTSVFYDAGVIILGAPGFNNDEGRVHLYNNPGAINFNKHLYSPNKATGEQFGYDVAYDADMLVVGAPGHVAGATVGAIYLFQRSLGGANNFGYVGMRAGTSGAVGPLGLGKNVAVVGDIIAASSEAINGNAGRVEIWGRNKGGTDAWGKLATIDGQPNDHLGQGLTASASLGLLYSAPDSQQLMGPGSPGYVARISSCGPGEVFNGTYCMACAVDTYQNDTKHFAPDCLPCPTGTYNNQTNSSSCPFVYQQIKTIAPMLINMQDQPASLTVDMQVPRTPGSNFSITLSPRAPGSPTGATLCTTQPIGTQATCPMPSIDYVDVGYVDVFVDDTPTAHRINSSIYVHNTTVAQLMLRDIGPDTFVDEGPTGPLFQVAVRGIGPVSPPTKIDLLFVAQDNASVFTQVRGNYSHGENGLDVYNVSQPVLTPHLFSGVVSRTQLLRVSIDEAATWSQTNDVTYTVYSAASLKVHTTVSPMQIGDAGGVVTFANPNGFTRSNLVSPFCEFGKLGQGQQAQGSPMFVPMVIAANGLSATCTLPSVQSPDQIGIYEVLVSLNGGATYTLVNNTELERFNATVTSISPDLVPANTSFVLTIFGVGFPVHSPSDIAMHVNTSASGYTYASSTASLMASQSNNTRLVFYVNPIDVLLPSHKPEVAFTVHLTLDGGQTSSTQTLEVYKSPTLQSLLPTVAITKQNIKAPNLTFADTVPTRAPNVGRCRIGATFTNPTYLVGLAALQSTDKSLLCGGGIPMQQVPHVMNIWYSFNNVHWHSAGDLVISNISIASRTPMSGPFAGATKVQFVGAGFDHPRFQAVVGFNTSSQYSYVSVNITSATTMELQTPAFEGQTIIGQQEMLLSMNNGIDFVKLAFPELQFVYYPSVVATSVGAATGDTNVPTPVTFTLGTYELVNLNGSSTCRFGNQVVPAYYVSQQSPLNVTCLSPVGQLTAGTGTLVNVTFAPNGQQYEATGLEYLVTSLDVVALNPTIVSSQGGVSLDVQVAGIDASAMQQAHAQGLLKVRLHGLGVVPGVWVAGAGAVRITTPNIGLGLPNPPHTFHTAQVDVSLNGGLSFSASSATLKLHDPQQLTQVSPRNMPITTANETVVTLGPDNLVSNTTLVEYALNNGTTVLLQAQAILSMPGSYSVQVPAVHDVLNATLRVSLNNGLEWTAPAPQRRQFRYSVSSAGFSPVNQPFAQGGSLTIRGSNFNAVDGPHSCLVDGVQHALTVVDTTTAHCGFAPIVGARTQTVQVMLNSRNYAPDNVVLFPRVSTPIVTFLDPPAIQKGVSRTVTIHGAHFLNDAANTRVQIDNQPQLLAVTSITNTSMVFQTPPFPLNANNVQLKITTNGGYFVSSAQGVLNLADPQLDQFVTASPRHVPVSGGTNVTVKGNDLFYVPSIGGGFSIKVHAPPSPGFLGQTVYMYESNGTVHRVDDKTASFIFPALQLPLNHGQSVAVQVFVSTNGWQTGSNGQPIDVFLEPSFQHTEPSSINQKQGGTIVLVGLATATPSMFARFTVPSTGFVSQPVPIVQQNNQFRVENKPELYIGNARSADVRIDVSFNGQQFHDFNSSFQLLTYVTPSLYSIDVPVGPSLGNTRVTIHGANFTVTNFSRVLCSSNVASLALVPADVLSPNNITFLTPPMTNGIQLPHNVQCRLAQNGETTELTPTSVQFGFYPPADQFKYTLAPSSGPSRGGTTVVVSKQPGSPEFQNTGFISVRFTNGSHVYTQPVTYVNQDVVQVVAPNTAPLKNGGTQGQFDMFLSLNGQQYNGPTSDPPKYIAYEDPQLLSVSPNLTPQTGGTVMRFNMSHTVPSVTSSPVVRFEAPDNKASANGQDCVSHTPKPGEYGRIVECRAPSFDTATAVTFPAQMTVRMSINGQEYGNSSLAVTYYPSPSVDVLTPTFAPLEGGLELTIAGTNFVTGNTGVQPLARFGGVTGATVPLQVIDDKTAKAVVPTSTTAEQRVVEVSFDGQTFTTNGRRITYYVAPTVTSVTPKSGVYNASTPVTILGENFPNTGSQMLVRVTSASANGTATATRVNDKEIRFTAPTVHGSDAGLPQMMQVEVAPNGVQFVGSAQARILYYTAPTVISTDVRSGPKGGGTRVTVYGQNFVNVSSIVAEFRSQIFVSNNKVSATFVSQSMVVCTTPPVNQGIVLPHDVDVRVSLNGLDAQFTTSTVPFRFYETSSSDKFNIAPKNAPITGNTQVTLVAQGSPFVDTQQIAVRVWDPTKTNVLAVVSGAQVNFVSATQVTLQTPAINPAVLGGNKQVSLPLSLALNGQQYDMESSLPLTVYVPPVVVAAFPNAVMEKQGPGAQAPASNVDVRVTGVDLFNSQEIMMRLEDANQQQIESAPCQFVSSSTTICTLPMPDFVGEGNLTLTLNGQQYSQSRVPFTVYARPSLTAVSPRLGPVSGGTVLTITGTNLRQFANAAVAVYPGQLGVGSLNNVVPMLLPMTVQSPTTALLNATSAFNVSVTQGVQQMSLQLSLNGIQYVAGLAAFGIYPQIAVTGMSPQAVAYSGQTVVIEGSFVQNQDATYRVRFTVEGNPNDVQVVNVNNNDVQSNRITLTSWNPSMTSARPFRVRVGVAANGEQFVESTGASAIVFDPPQLASFNTTSAIVQGGTPMHITGTGFVDTGVSRVVLRARAGQTPVLTVEAPLTIHSSTSASFVAPTVNAVTYAFDPYVQLGGSAAGEATLPNTIISYVTERRISSIVPPMGPAVQGNTNTRLVLSGSQLLPLHSGDVCQFTLPLTGQVLTTALAQETATTVSCAFPSFTVTGVETQLPAPVRVDVTSALGVGVSGVPKSVLLYREPIVEDLLPAAGRAAGNFRVFVRGQYFLNMTNTMRCRFDTNEVAAEFHNSTTVSCVAPAHLEGNVEFELTLNGQAYHAMPGVNDLTYEGCAPGTFSTAFTVPCQPCAAGTFRALQGGLSECNDCAENTYCPTGATEALQCPANAISLANSKALKDCRCAPNFYTQTGQPGTPCLACPVGASCAGQENAPIAQSGYWSSAATGSFVFFACDVPASCPGGSAVGAISGCAAGYTGRMCSACARGYYRLEKLCEKCPEGASTMVIVAGVVFALFLMGLRKFGTAKGGSLAISLTHLQIAAMYADFRLPWPDLLLQFLSLLSVVNLNLDVTAPECTVADWSYESKFYLTMALPLAVLWGLGILLLLQHGASLLRTYWEECRGRRFSRHVMDDLPQPDTIYDRVMVFLLPARPVTSQTIRVTLNSFLGVCSLMYIVLASKALEVFDCTKLGPNLYSLDAFGEIDCWTDRHWNLVYWGTAATLLYVIGIPLAYVMIIWRNRKHLHEEETKMTFGAVYDKYRPDLFWFEPIVMLRKISIIFVKLFATQAPLLQGLGSMYIFIISVMFQLTFKPFATRLQNLQESMFLSFNLLLLLSGISFMSSAYPNQQARDMMAVVTVGLIVVMLLLALVFVARDLHQSLTHIQQAIRGSSAKTMAYLDTHFEEDASLDDVKEAIRVYAKSYLSADGFDALMYHMRRTLVEEDLRFIVQYFQRLREFEVQLGGRKPYSTDPMESLASERVRALSLKWIDSNEQAKQGFLDLLSLLSFKHTRLRMFSREAKNPLTSAQQQMQIIRNMEKAHNVDVAETAVEEKKEERRRRKKKRTKQPQALLAAGKEEMAVVVVSQHDTADVSDTEAGVDVVEMIEIPSKGSKSPARKEADEKDDEEEEPVALPGTVTK